MLKISKSKRDIPKAFTVFSERKYAPVNDHTSSCIWVALIRLRGLMITEKQKRAKKQEERE